MSENMHHLYNRVPHLGDSYAIGVRAGVILPDAQTTSPGVCLDSSSPRPCTQVVANADPVCACPPHCACSFHSGALQDLRASILASL